MAAARDYLSLVRFSHSVFALPFALAALLVASDGRPSARVALLVVLAMVCARTAAMAYNRLVDRDVDALNPRTAGREIPRGAVTPGQAAALVAIAGAGFVLCAALLSAWCFWLSLPVLALLLGYSHAKRFTAWTHVWLGVALGLAPPAAALAVHGRIDAAILPPLWLGAGVTLWVAGFDVLYACQDEAFDRVHGLRSLPVRLGRRTAMRLSQAAHAGAVILFALFGVAAGLGAVYHAGVAAAAAFLAWEHWLLRGGDLRRIDAAFFTMNGLVGLAVLACTMADLYL
jgi:4-hydroxybenzoate polyprenyltransferase